MWFFVVLPRSERTCYFGWGPQLTLRLNHLNWQEQFALNFCGGIFSELGGLTAGFCPSTLWPAKCALFSKGTLGWQEQFVLNEQFRRSLFFAPKKTHPYH
jgi:hypothetical protein